MNETSIDLQVFFATGLMVLIFIGVFFAGAYIWVLTRFFKELSQNEPEVWEEIGRPTLTNMLFLPFVNFRKFYAFLPILKARKKSEYKYAKRAHILLWFGLIYCLLLLVNVIALSLSLS